MARTGRDVPVLGKVSVARALRSSSPLCRVTCASHGPAGSRVSRTIVTGSVSPIASVDPSAAANGPALSPAGPSESCRVPFRSSARPPSLCTVATTIGRPSAERSAVNERIVKSGRRRATGSDRDVQADADAADLRDAATGPGCRARLRPDHAVALAGCRVARNGDRHRRGHAATRRNVTSVQSERTPTWTIRSQYVRRSRGRIRSRSWPPRGTGRRASLRALCSTPRFGGG